MNNTKYTRFNPMFSTFTKECLFPCGWGSYYGLDLFQSYPILKHFTKIKLEVFIRIVGVIQTSESIPQKGWVLQWVTPSWLWFMNPRVTNSNSRLGGVSECSKEWEWIYCTKISQDTFSSLKQHLKYPSRPDLDQVWALEFHKNLRGVSVSQGVY